MVKARRAAKSIVDDADDVAADETELIWQQLWAGGYRVARIADSDGKRLVVLRRAPHGKKAPSLTPAERRIVELAARGASLKVIAIELGKAASTVSTHLSHALRKLGLAERGQLITLLGQPRTRSSTPNSNAR